MSGRKSSFATAVLAVLCAACGGPAIVATPTPLSRVLAACNATASTEGSELLIQALDREGAPIPHALLHFAWPEGGRTAFQSDESGTLCVRLPEGPPAADPLLEVRTFRDGQDLLAAEYDESSRPVPDASLSITLAARPPGE